jgi:type IV secretory pathway TraG/TraD family ATPase VirD4
MPSNRRRDPGSLSSETVLIVAFVVVSVVGGGSVWIAVTLGALLAGTAGELPGDPFAVVLGALTGDVAWPAPATWILVVLGVVVAALVTLVALWWQRSVRTSTRADRAAGRLGFGKDIEPVTVRAAAGIAARLGVDGPPGLPMGTTVRGGTEVVSSWEDMRVTLAGARFGKSTSFVVPNILVAPGPVVTTSNKRDVCDATRDVRAGAGQVWVFDPQQIALEPPTWWWDPLSYVIDETRAQRMAEHFAAFAKRPDAKEDAYFTPAARTLVRGLLLVAHLAGKPITQCFIWTTRPADDEPVRLLRRHPEYELIAAELDGMYTLPDKQRAGVFGGAQQMLSPLTNSRLAEWVTPRGNRPHFDPHAFVRSKDTMYLLSLEGADNAGPIVTALTVAIAEAAVEHATASGGRLPVPMVMELDEAANVCRWMELPNLYSHYGSRGIIIDTVFQNRPQGEEIWGKTGIDKLIGASNVLIYAGNIKDTDFLRWLSEILGDYDHESVSVSYQRGGRDRNTSRQLNRRRIFEVSELAELPKGRAIVLAGGSRSTLIRTQPWMTGPHADAVKASIEAHDPRAAATLREAAKELAAVEQELAAAGAVEAAQSKEDVL